MNTEIFGLSIKAGLARANQIQSVDSTLKSRIDDSVAGNFCAFVQRTKELREIKCTDVLFVDEIRQTPVKSEVNFLTCEGKTLNVWTGMSKRLKICPKGVGQPGKALAGEIFAPWLRGYQVDKDKFKRIVLEYPDELISMYLEALLEVDINVFVWPSKSDDSFKFTVLRSDDVTERKIEKDDISFTKSSVEEWNESNTVKVGGQTIGEFQVHSAPSRFVKFRFDILGLGQVIERKKQDNAMIGRTLEFALAKYYNVQVPEMSIDEVLLHRITSKLQISGIADELRLQTYCGNLQGAFRLGSKSPVDFLGSDGKTISVKSIKGKRGKICAPEVGQPSPKTFDYYYGDMGLYQPPINQDKFRKLVFDCTRPYLMKQAEWLFDCDFLLLMMDAVSPNFHVMKRGDLKVLSQALDRAIFTFSVSREDWINGKRNSMTVYANGNTCGEVQVHKNRSSLKFRFDSNYLLTID